MQTSPPLTQPAPTASRPTGAEGFRHWLAQEIAQSIDVPQASLDLDQSIHGLGLSSVHVVRLAGEIEERLGIEVDPTSFYEYASLALLCEDLLRMHERRQTRGGEGHPHSGPRHGGNSRPRPALATPYATPRTGWEQRLCAIWRDVLRLDQVGIHDGFRALGGDAAQAARACERMWDMGVPESLNLDGPRDATVADLGEAIEALRAGDGASRRAEPLSLVDEALLAPDIGLPGNDPARYDTPMRRVLLTGATGHLGAFLLHELMQQTQAQVLCLVRAATPEEGLARVRANLRKHRLETPGLAERLAVLPADLAQAGLGLEPARFDALAQEIDTIVHSAAWVNFVFPYEHLKASNVDATETLLRLACRARPRPIQFHHVSTLGVIMSSGFDRTRPFPEASPPPHADDLLNGYEQSKWASDRKVWTAFTERGIPAVIYRPPLVSGWSTGAYDKLDEFLPMVLKGCLQMQSFPALDSLWEIVPIDFVSKAIVHIARHPKNLNRAYFITHPHSVPVRQHMQWYQRAGFALRDLTWEAWKQELLALGPEALGGNALAPFVDFVRALSRQQVEFPAVETQRFRDAIADMDFQLPPALTLLERYTRHFIASGFYADVPGVPAHLRASPS